MRDGDLAHRYQLSAGWRRPQAVVGRFSRESSERARMISDADGDRRVGEVEDQERAEVAEVEVGVIDHVAEVGAVADVAERAAEDQRQRQRCRPACLSRSIHTSTHQRDQRRSTPTSSQRISIEFGGEHAERDAVVLGQRQVEERQQLDRPAPRSRPSGPITSALDRTGRATKISAARARPISAVRGQTFMRVASSFATTLIAAAAQRAVLRHSGSSRQQRPHLWLSVRVTATLASDLPGQVLR